MNSEGELGIEYPVQVPFSVDITTDETRKQWLSDQTAEVCGVVATRSALRVVPAFTLAASRNGSRLTRRRAMLRVFRAVAASWVAWAHPSHRASLSEKAREALIGLGDVRASSPERAAAYAIASLLSEDAEIPARASTAIGYALDAAGTFGKEAFEVTVDAIKIDASLMREGFSGVTLANSKLWPKQPPGWVLENWTSSKDLLLAENEHWDIWIEWYDARLFGEPSNIDLELARFIFQSERWSEEPKVVNERIKAAVQLAGNLSSEVISGNATQPTHAQRSGNGTFGTGPFGAGPFGGQRSEAPLSQSDTTIREWVEGSASEVTSRFEAAPELAEQLVRNAAREIGRSLTKLSEKIPNEPSAHAGYEEIKQSLTTLQAGLEEVALELQAGREEASPQERTGHFRRAALCARTVADNFLDWMEENSKTSGRVVAHLGLATIITATISYVAGVNPTTTFIITAGALSGQDIWEVVKQFAKKD